MAFVFRQYFTKALKKNEACDMIFFVVEAAGVVEWQTQET